MEIDSPESKAFLFELYSRTQGDTDAQVSTQDVGAALGLDENEAGTMAENLFIQGFAEMKTLSGGIGITRQGLEVLDIKMPPKPGEEILSLGAGPVLETEGKDAVEKIVREVKETLARSGSDYPQLEEVVIDLKTLEVQMLSPNVKTAIIREVLRSIQAVLGSISPGETADRLDQLIRS